MPFNKVVYLLYGCDEQPHDVNMYYGEYKFYKLGTYDTMEECDRNKIKGVKYDSVVCLKAYQ
jgi:hypothetical protein